MQVEFNSVDLLLFMQWFLSFSTLVLTENSIPLCTRLSYAKTLLQSVLSLYCTFRLLGVFVLLELPSLPCFCIQDPFFGYDTS